MLTTQFYFPNEKANLADEFFHSELVIRVVAADDALRAQFNVVLATAPAISWMGCTSF